MDKKLKERIVEVFDNYDDGASETGWQKLREKFPPRPLRPIFWVPVLAILLLGGTLVFLNTDSQEDQKKKTAEKIEASPEDLIIRPDTLINPSDGKGDHSVPERLVENNRALENKKWSDQRISYNTTPSTSSLQNVSPPLTNTIPFTESTLSKAVNLPAAEQNNENQSVTSSLPPDLLKQDSIASDMQKLADKKLERKRIEFEIYGGPHLNYSEGSFNTVNFKAGFNADIILNKRLSLVTGFSLAQNNMTYANQLPSASFLNDVFNNSSQASAVQKLDFTASLLSLDMPVNLKYSLDMDHKFFIIAGLSSSTYLKEAYLFNYRVQTANTFTANQNYTSYKKFKTFDIAKMINLSLAMTYFIGPQELTIEPFLKHPLGNLGSQNIAFGSTGVVLKMNISRKKEIVNIRE